MEPSCKNNSGESTTNPHLLNLPSTMNKRKVPGGWIVGPQKKTTQSQSQPRSPPAGSPTGTPRSPAPCCHPSGAPGSSPGSSPTSSHTPPIFLSVDEHSSNSNSEQELKCADHVIRLLNKGRKPKKKRVYNFYEEIALRQLTDLCKRRDEIMKHLRSTPWPNKSNDQAEPSRPAPTNDENQKTS